jgi:Gpi18-like mannosyltransferase
MTIKKLLLYFLVWRIGISLFIYLGIFLFPLQIQFLGGGLDNLILKPQLWSLVNFDGEHFLSITQNGYQPLTYFYFPGYPFLIKFLTSFLGTSTALYTYMGLFVSHVAFFVGLFGFIKLIKIDFDDKVAEHAVITLLIFPTSFYFAAYYSESLFFCLTIWSFYFFRKNRYFLSSVLGTGSSFTRLVGIALPIALSLKLSLSELKNSNKKLMISKIFAALSGFLGISIYMVYLEFKTGDYLEFFHSVSIFGDQRSSRLIILPQVFYRYFVKILPSVDYSYFPAIFYTYLEIVIAILFLLLIVYGHRRLDVSYTLFALIAYLIPSLSGSFSSFPRYALAIFPAFILGGYIVKNIPKIYRIVYLGISLFLLLLSTALFTRGYWIS